MWVLCGSARAQDSPNSVDVDALTASLDELRAAFEAPGMAVAVVHHDEVLLLRGFGSRDLEAELPVTARTLFPIGSVTKSFTAALVGVLEGHDLLTVHDRPAAHVEELVFRDPAMDAVVTLEDLLSHRSGIGGVDGTHVFFPVDDRSRHAARLQHLRPTTGVRERFAYSNLGYALLGLVCERATERSWETLIEEELFAPLAMERSGTRLAELTADEDFARGYAMVDGVPEVGLYEDQHESGPSGAIHSSAEDMARWVRMLLAHGRLADAEVVPAGYVARTFSPVVHLRAGYDAAERDLRLDAYGYGWFLNAFEGRFRVEHGGNVPGFTARVDLLPGEHLGVVVLTNQQSSSLAKEAAERVYRHVLGLPRRATASLAIQVEDAPPFEPEPPPAARRARPGRPLASYAGAYHDPGYGTLVVTHAEGALTAAFPAFSFALDATGPDAFVLRRHERIHRNSPTFPVLFTANEEGEVEELRLPLQAGGVRFRRVP